MCESKGYLHFLSNSGVFLKQQIHVHVNVTCLYTPSHSTYNLIDEDNTIK